MTTEPPPEHLRLQQLIDYPREDLGIEYKRWLDLREESARATIAKAAIAMANHGGGYVILGFEERGQNLESQPIPQGMHEITQDAVNSAISRYADPPFHCEVYYVEHSSIGALHPIIQVRGGDVPIMTKRDQKDAKVSQYAIYIRKPGPCSEQARTAEEWRQLLDRCVRSRREDMLDAVRTIVVGQVEPQSLEPEPLETLKDYCLAARQRWSDLVAGEPAESSARFPYGNYEMGFALVGASPAQSHAEILNRIRSAGQISLSGWPPFLELYDSDSKPRPYEESVEAWIATLPEESIIDDSISNDYWRASLDGKIYTARAYVEDSTKYPLYVQPSRSPGRIFCGDWQIMNIAEGILFASRYAETFEGSEELAIRLRFTGLGGRSFVPSYRVRHLLSLDRRGHGHTCRTDRVVLEEQVGLRYIQDNVPEIVHRLLTPLFAYFDFYQLPFRLVSDALQERRIG